MSESNVGKIRQIIGPTIDVEFDSDSLPDIFNAVTVDRESGERLVTEVAQHVGNNIVRCVAMGPTDGLVRDNVVQNEAVSPDLEKRDLGMRCGVNFKVEL